MYFVKFHICLQKFSGFFYEQMDSLVVTRFASKLKFWSLLDCYLLILLAGASVSMVWQTTSQWFQYL